MSISLHINKTGTEENVFQVIYSLYDVTTSTAVTWLLFFREILFIKDVKLFPPFELLLLSVNVT